MKLLIALLLTINTCWGKSTNDLPSSVLLYNQTTGAKIIDHNTDQVRALASITKLMTAIVAIDSGISPYEQLPLYQKLGSLLPKKNWTREELMTAMLVRSDNAAAETLARDYPGGRAKFMEAMNAKSIQLGMYNTHFDDPSGLSSLNKSTANDIAKLLLESAKYDVIRQNSVKKQAIFETKVKKTVRTITLNHTSSKYLFEFDNIVVTKTGLTTPARWCVALLVEQKGQTFLIVVLGSKTKQQRLDKVKEIMYNHIIDQHI
jgi:D-alanyl-D-alanine endopeptidase (penicillin-binding protein 7)